MDRCLRARDQGASAIRRGVAHGIAWSQWGLVGIRTQGDVGGDPVAVMAQVVVGAGRSVFQLGWAHVSRQAVLAALGAVLQRGIARHAQLWREGKVIQKSAIAHDAGQRATVDKTLLLQPGGELQGALFSGLHGRAQAVGAVVELRVFFLQGGAVQGQGLHFELAVKPHVHPAQGGAGLVLQAVFALYLCADVLGVQVYLQSDVRDGGLGQALKRQQRFFVVGGQLFQLRPGGVVVEHIGVVKDPAAQAQPRCGAQAQQHTRRATQPAAQQGHAGLQAGFCAPTPHEVGAHQQHAAKRQPIGLVPGPPDPEMAHGVHVRQGHRRHVAKVVQLVLKTQHIQRDAGNQVHQHDAPAHRLLRYQCLHKDAQYGQQQGRNEVGQHKPQGHGGQVNLRKAMEQLKADAKHGCHYKSGQQYQADGNHFRNYKGPVG